ncbi:MAG: hypothetical protein GX200_02660 [Firmicutes bacterium]|nr:hypothetical protein [Bacillota bacterium]
MLCENCKERQATVHLTKIINDEKYVQHLCEKCAREKGEFDFEFPSFSLQNLLSGLMNLDAQPAGQVMGFAAQKLQCDNCGLTYAQFGQLGRFGCSRCYDAFGERLVPLLRRIHGSTQHLGKIPRRAGGTLKLRRSIEELRQKLQEAVAREEFEQAAKLRDQIRELEEQAREGENNEQ